jgi:hypothetical protein
MDFIYIINRLTRIALVLFGCRLAAVDRRDLGHSQMKKKLRCT